GVSMKLKLAILNPPTLLASFAHFPDVRTRFSKHRRPRKPHNVKLVVQPFLEPLCLLQCLTVSRDNHVQSSYLAVSSLVCFRPCFQRRSQHAPRDAKPAHLANHMRRPIGPRMRRILVNVLPCRFRHSQSSYPLSIARGQPSRPNAHAIV